MTRERVCRDGGGLRILAGMNDPALFGKEVLARIRHRIALRIDEMGISVAKLARRSGLSERTIHRLLHEPKRDVYVSTVAAISMVLLIDMRELLEPLPDTPAPPDQAEPPPPLEE